MTWCRFVSDHEQKENLWPIRLIKKDDESRISRRDKIALLYGSYTVPAYVRIYNSESNTVQIVTYSEDRDKVK